MTGILDFRVGDIRDALAAEFLTLRDETDIADDIGMVEIVGASFIADEPSIFGEVNYDYIDREIALYDSESPFVTAIPGGPPEIWRDVSGFDGSVNSNYGRLFKGGTNGYQYAAVVRESERDRDSRRATAIYTNPMMHIQARLHARNDFVCTNAVNYRINNGRLNATVQMRSNDAIFGYRNDYAWQKRCLEQVAHEVKAEPGDIIWQAASLHVYPRHHHLIETYVDFGEWNVKITKEQSA